jgi:uncharacterized protein YjbI with pentapeptide repeats
MFLVSLNGDILYEGRAHCIADLLAQAVREEVDLSGVNLRRASLRGVDLRGAILKRACLWGADLRNADLTDAILCGADCRVANMKRANLTLARCEKADFRGARMNEAKIYAADFKGCEFSCPAVLALPLHLSKRLEDAVYWHLGEYACELSAFKERRKAKNYSSLLSHKLINDYMK